MTNQLNPREHLKRKFKIQNIATREKIVQILRPRTYEKKLGSTTIEEFFIASKSNKSNFIGANFIVKNKISFLQE